MGVRGRGERLHAPRAGPAGQHLHGLLLRPSRCLLAETGATTGAIQIAGTDKVHRSFPVFSSAACDYTLLGEELLPPPAPIWARSRSSSRRFIAQDWAKALAAAAVVVALVLAALGNTAPHEMASGSPA